MSARRLREKRGFAKKNAPELARGHTSEKLRDLKNKGID
jgi:hypothetical protein